MKASQIVAASILKRENVLDNAWDRINALGGTSSARDDWSAGYNSGVDAALLIIEELGGMDPLIRKQQREGAPV
jgi:hypothetical protein